MEQKNYWNKAAKKKEFTTPFQAEEFSKQVRKEGIILDVGCGYGRTLDELYQIGYQHLIGIDFSEKMIERGRMQFPYLDLRVKKDTKIDMPDASADAVILFAVLTCISTNKEQVELIQEIYRVLKPKGILYVNDFLLNTDERNVNRYKEFSDTYEYGTFQLPDGIVCRHHDIKWIEQLLSLFLKKRYGKLTFTTMNGHKSNGFFFLGEK